MKNRIMICVCFLVLSPSSIIAMEWRGIVPLHSSRSDVERILGVPLSSGKYISSYELANEFADVIYASGPPCGRTLVDSWRVPRDTVLSIRVVPKNNLVLSRVMDDHSGYNRMSEFAEKGLFYYTNEQLGLRYTVQSEEGVSDGNIVSIDYLPAKSEYGLKCSSLETHDKNQSVPAFERYGNISSSMEKAILDNFAIQLHRNKNLKGYVVVYVGKAAKVKEGKKRIRYIKSYLINKRRVPRMRVKTMYGGPAAEPRVELYLAPLDKPGPTLRR